MTARTASDLACARPLQRTPRRYRAALALLASTLVAGAAASAQRNVLLVVADDLGTDRLAVYGEGTDVPPTPTIDALASAGVVFRNCWANPVCSPTRATLQTGRYSFRTGVGNALPFSSPLALAERTLPEALDELGTGHASALTGKWHLGGSALTVLGALNPNLQGYDHFAGTLAGAFVGPFGYELWPRTVDGMTGLSRTYATTASVDDALAFVEAQDGPWFVNLAFHAPHTPFHAPPDALHSRDLPDAAPCDEPVPFHDAAVEALDRELGRFLASLDRATLRNTTVVLVGDNGTTSAVAQAPLDPRRAKGTLYQGGIRVPLIVAGPEVVLPGRDALALVNTTDLFATVVELAGGDVAALSGGPPEDSVSLLPLLTNPLSGGVRAYAYAELDVPTLPWGGASAATDGERCLAVARLTPGQALRGARYKLIRFDDGDEELYDLWLDPGEEDDLLSGDAPLALGGPVLSAYVELTAELDRLLAD